MQYRRLGCSVAVQQVSALARRNHVTTAQFALAWVLREANVASAIIGATRAEQVTENATASGATIDPADFVEAERILASAA